MVKIALQKYLNQKFPTQEDKEKIKEIGIYQFIEEDKNNKINGRKLDLSKYTNLEKIDIDGNYLESKLARLILGSKPKLKELHCSNNELTNLDLNDCPVLEAIVCDGNQLTELKLGQLENLTKLDCENNEIEELDIKDCPNLKYLACSYNLLTNLDLSQNPRIKILKIRDNNFSEQDLSFLENLVNLRLLWIDNVNKDGGIENSVFNRFTGSLEPLRGTNKLKDFRFSDTDLGSGLEYLPESLQRLECAVKFRTDAKVKIIKEELENYGVSEKLDNFVHLFLVWKEFSSPAKEWLDENYPINEVCRRKEDKENYDKKRREEIINLDISKQDLEKGLKLKDFVALEKLNCSENQLTNLDLNDCLNLIELDCSNNELHNLDFLKSVDKLKSVSIHNNPKIPFSSLVNLNHLKELNYLNIADCRMEGSLKNLEELKKLGKLDISYTDINEGLEYLPESCKKVYCNSGYQYKSTKIMEELDKSKCSEREDGVKYYDLDKWREHKEDGRVASVVPLERLYVIRGNIRKFISKWGKETEDSWYERFVANLKVEEGERNELSNLQSPKEFGIYRYTKSVKWIARAGAVGGGVLALTDNSVLGGAFATIFPFVEILASNAEDELYSVKQQKWDEFTIDVENLLDNYHELLGILEQIKKSELGKVNQVLNDLRGKVKLFLHTYDKPSSNGQKNRIIDISELTSPEARKELAKDLIEEDKERGGGSQLGNIILAIQKLEEAINYYRQDSPEKEVEGETNSNKEVNVESPHATLEIQTEENSSQRGSFLDDGSSTPFLRDFFQAPYQNSEELELEEFSSQEQSKTQIEVPPKK